MELCFWFLDFSLGILKVLVLGLNILVLVWTICDLTSLEIRAL